MVWLCRAVACHRQRRPPGFFPARPFPGWVHVTGAHPFCLRARRAARCRLLVLRSPLGVRLHGRIVKTPSDLRRKDDLHAVCKDSAATIALRYRRRSNCRGRPGRGPTWFRPEASATAHRRRTTFGVEASAICITTDEPSGRLTKSPKIIVLLPCVAGSRACTRLGEARSVPRGPKPIHLPGEPTLRLARVIVSPVRSDWIPNHSRTVPAVVLSIRKKPLSPIVQSAPLDYNKASF